MCKRKETKEEFLARHFAPLGDANPYAEFLAAPENHDTPEPGPALSEEESEALEVALTALAAAGKKFEISVIQLLIDRLTGEGGAR